MARRRYMHGKRRRKSSCAPFKSHHTFKDTIISQAKKEQEENPDSHFVATPHPTQTKEVRAASELYQKQKWGVEPGYEGEHWFENALEFFDPTGIYSHDDYARNPDDPLEGVGVIPAFGGKAKKVYKAFSGAINLVKKTDPVKLATKVKGGIVDGLHWLGVGDNVRDVYQDNIKPAIFPSDKKETTPRGTGEVHKMLGISKK